LKVYGRKFPVFDNTLIKRRQWSAVVQTAKPIVYLPFTEDTFDPAFVISGKEFLITTARQAIEELRLAKVPARPFAESCSPMSFLHRSLRHLRSSSKPMTRTTSRKRALAFDEVLSQYGLKREEAYRYSLSDANALGPMQFTNRKGNGTYAYVVRRCRGAKLDPVFESGATNLLNAMKAAACLLDFNVGVDAGGYSSRVSCQSGSAGHLSGRRVQRRIPQRREALSCPDENERDARRTQPAGSAAHRRFGDLSLRLESRRRMPVR